MQGLESLYTSRPFTEHARKIMRTQAVEFMANVYGVEL
jgi:hypothetical protein